MYRWDNRVLVACLIALVAAVLPASAAHARGMTKAEYKMVRAVNQMRAQWGLPHLRPDRPLARAAEDHSEDMGNNSFFAHNSFNGTDAFSRVMAYTSRNMMGETIAWMPMDANTSARHILDMWMHSEGHRATLTTRRFRRIGIGRVHGRLNGERVVLWTADLTSAR